MNIVKNNQKLTGKIILDAISTGAIVNISGWDACFYMVTDEKNGSGEILLVDIENGGHIYYHETTAPVEIYDAEIILTKRE